ncbi:MAG TPA: twin-arginine translocase TatA/TatE family subunit [Acidimicrobiia bacterium]|jgi:sec-independent protein translocase protein TatA|nr:twin-arginine translocase TatA/TatE family subunit [Acidimicrobiia bacterium]
MRFSGPELVIILVIILLLFGARKLPDLARSLGASAKEFRKGVDEGSTEEPTAAEPQVTTVEPEVTVVEPEVTVVEPEKKID